MVIGIFLGLVSAFIWATTSLAIKAQSDRINTSSFNAFRMIVGTLFSFALLPFFGGLQALAQVPTPTLIVLSISSVIGIAVGDTLYFWGMTKIGTSRALPLSGTYPLFTWMLAVPILGEPLTWSAMLGTGLVLVGVYFLSPQKETISRADTRATRLGVIATLAAAALWAIATMMLKLGMQDGMPVVVINSIRLPFAMIGALVVTHCQSGIQAWRGYNRRTLPMQIALAVYSTGIGMIVWTLTVEYAGAARAALLNTAAPLIGVPLSILFLKERVTPRMIMGTLLSVFGVWLIL